MHEFWNRRCRVLHPRQGMGFRGLPQMRHGHGRKTGDSGGGADHREDRRHLQGVGNLCGMGRLGQGRQLDATPQVLEGFKVGEGGEAFLGQGLRRRGFVRGGPGFSQGRNRKRFG
ncbi:MAG TPA: hypothetical protein VGJ89_12535, partial [Geothrix sp.]